MTQLQVKLAPRRDWGPGTGDPVRQVTTQTLRWRATQVERIFTYGHADGDAALALGADRGRVKMAVGGATCWLDSIVTPADWTSSALGLCLLWASPGGHVGVYFNGKHWAKTCSDSGGRAVRGGGAFRLGGETLCFRDVDPT